MSTVGIIAEFNPFHNGHAYAIKKAKELTGADTAIVVMSGDFVQRGAPAICDKYIRTEMALADGADAVFELPVCFATESAQGFAEGACALLTMTGIVDYICFGSECGDIKVLSNIAEVIGQFESDSEFHNKLMELTRSGIPFPAARAEIIALNTGIDPTIISSPNNILAIEYCLALQKLSQKFRCPVPVTFRRKGDSYNADNISDSAYTSATAIRRLLSAMRRGGELSILEPYMPVESLRILQRNLGAAFPISEDDFSTALFVKIKNTPEICLRQLPGINKDLLNSIINHTQTPIKISKLIVEIKSKAFTYTAISRALFTILLSPCPDHTQLTASDTLLLTGSMSDNICEQSVSADETSDCNQNISEQSGSADQTSDTDSGISSVFVKKELRLPEYLRLLGFRRSSSRLLHDIRENASIPIITKLADADLSSEMLQQDINSAMLYEQIKISKFGSNGYKDEYRTGVVIKNL